MASCGFDLSLLPPEAHYIKSKGCVYIYLSHKSTETKRREDSRLVMPTKFCKEREAIEPPIWELGPGFLRVGMGQTQNTGRLL